MLDDEYDDRIEALLGEIEGLKRDILKKQVKDRSFNKVVEEETSVLEIRKNATKACRTLKGHFGKVYALQWSSDSNNIVSASQGGQLILWNAYSTNKLNAIALKTSWVMSCSIDQHKGNFVACGGLDNMCSIYRISNGSSNEQAQDPQSQLVSELVAHDGYISCCRFIGDKNIVSASGDSSCIYWDLQRGEILNTFYDHGGDVMFISLHPTDPNIFVTGSIDHTAKLWDIRSGKSTQTHFGHEGDVNSVAFFPDGRAFATGSEDSTCRIFDIRSYGEVKRFGGGTGITAPITTVDFSRSGRLLFAGSVDNQAYGYDVMQSNTSTATQPILNFSAGGHEKRITCLQVSPKGDGMCTGSWDATLKIWA